MANVEPRKKIFVRYKEGAEMYSMCQKTFEMRAKEAGAVYKVGKAVLVNCDIFEKYWNCFVYRPNSGNY